MAEHDTLVDQLQDAYVESKKIRQKAEHHRLRVQNDLHWEAFGADSMIVVPLPKDRPIKILDSGTGDGYWMYQEAKNYPNASFTGTDIEEDYFQEINEKNVNVCFKIQSVREEWPMEDKDSYDLVHQRYTMTNMPPNEAASIVERLLGLAKPGGYIQLVEVDLMGYDREGHPGMSEMMDFMGRFFALGNMDPATGPKLADWLRAAGAEDVETRLMSFGMGKRGKTKSQQENSTWNELTLIDNFSFVCEQIPGFWYSAKQFKELSRLVHEEMETIGNTWRFYVTTGKRPHV